VASDVRLFSVNAGIEMGLLVPSRDNDVANGSGDDIGIPYIP
jgi:hypothetical protein